MQHESQNCPFRDAGVLASDDLIHLFRTSGSCCRRWDPAPSPCRAPVSVRGTSLRMHQCRVSTVVAAVITIIILLLLLLFPLAGSCAEHHSLRGGEPAVLWASLSPQNWEPFASGLLGVCTCSKSLGLRQSLLSPVVFHAEQHERGDKTTGWETGDPGSSPRPALTADS